MYRDALLVTMRIKELLAVPPKPPGTKRRRPDQFFERFPYISDWRKGVEEAKPLDTTTGKLGIRGRR